MSKEFEVYAEKILLKRVQGIKDAVLGEIKEIAEEHGVTTEIEINENAVMELIRKAVPKKPQLREHYAVCECGTVLMNVIVGVKNCLRYCECCGQKIDWSEYDAECK